MEPYLALLSYRATPLPWCGLSPAEFLMGRRLQTDIPQPKRVFIPDWPYLTSFHVKDKEQKSQQKAEDDRRHRVKPLPLLPDDELVRVRTHDRQVSRRVVQCHDPTWWILHLIMSIGTKATYYQDLVKDRLPQFQLSRSNVPSAHQTHILKRCGILVYRH